MPCPHPCWAWSRFSAFSRPEPGYQQGYRADRRPLRAERTVRAGVPPRPRQGGRCGVEDRQLRQDLDRADRVRLARRSLVQDARSARRHLWLNVLAGAAVTPRVLRYWMYQRAGVETATPNIFSGSVIHGRSALRIGERTFINHGCYFEANAPITIGEECSVGMEVLIVTSSHPLDETGRFSARSTYLPVTIGNRCWIG